MKRETNCFRYASERNSRVSMRSKNPKVRAVRSLPSIRLCRRWQRDSQVDVLCRSDGRGLSTPLIKSQMNGINGAIISYRYYRDGYYVSRRRARSLSFVSLYLSYSPRPVSLRLVSSPTSPLSLSISLLRPLFLLVLLLSLETLLLLHARNQVTALQESKSRRCTRESAD